MDRLRTQLDTARGPRQRHSQNSITSWMTMAKERKGILCLDALLQIHLFTLPGFRLCCRVEESNECYQHLCRLVNKYPTSECPGICRFTAAEYNRIGAIGPEEEGRMPSKICLNLAWITTATPTPTTTEATMRLRAARSIAYFRDLDTESNTCERLCERLFNRIVDDSSSCTLANDRKCFFKSCRYIIGDVADLDDYEECPSICYSMSDGMHYLYLPVPLTMKAVRNICNTFDFPENTRKPRRTTESTTAVTYPKKQVFDCTELCEHVYPEILERYKYLCPVREKKLYYCVLSSCKEVINRTVMDDGRDPKDACPKMCLSMATAMLGRNMDRRLYGKEDVSEFCSSIDSTTKTTTESPADMVTQVW
ncbi:hypothetical protein RB195_017417 [Necator americanus]|uniref:DB module n=1 Tax=Necator americanus TaxID=51031 RepID=A0ABR1C893_NECAM